MINFLLISLLCIYKCATACSPPTCIHGDCNLGVCECHLGWEGSECNNITVCSPTCQNGLCESGSCICLDGWNGMKCDTENICAVSCVNGICQGSVCFCQDGYTGIACEVANLCEDACDKGECIQDECYCRDGFTGRTCSEKVSDKVAAAEEGVSPLSIVLFIGGGMAGAITCFANWKGHKQREQLLKHSQEDSDINVILGDGDDNPDSSRKVTATRNGSTINVKLSRSSSMITDSDLSHNDSDPEEQI